jgi:FMN phosphatase YigB (HAD superfamily)
MPSSGRKILTFDCYNTLVDTSLLADALGGIAQQYSLQDEASRLCDIFYHIEYDLMYGAAFFTLNRRGDTGDEQYQPYTEVHHFRRVPEVLAI